MQGLLEPTVSPCEPRHQGVRWDSAAAKPQQRLLRGYLHKTSNALCGIKGYASLIAQLGQDAGMHASWAQKIIREVEKMESLFASVDGMTAPAPLEHAEQDADQVLAFCLDQACRRHNNLRVHGEAELPGRLMLPAADLIQVLKDILDNAAEGGDGHAGEVRVVVSSGRSESGRITLTVSDDAGGIPLHLGGQVRDPFVTGKPGHLGIGLSRVETILDMHGLDWSLSSDHGLGTKVTMEVAVAARSAVLAGKAGDGA